MHGAHSAKNPRNPSTRFERIERDLREAFAPQERHVDAERIAEIRAEVLGVAGERHRRRATRKQFIKEAAYTLFIAVCVAAAWIFLIWEVYP